MDRVYVLKYKIHVNLYSLNKPNIETRVEYYGRNERDKFIGAYNRIKDKYYIQEVETFYANLERINMDDVINAI